MRRIGLLLLAMLGPVALVTAAAAQAPGSRVLVSGNPMIAIIDGNGDGPGKGDCDFMATLDGSMFHVFAMQDQHTPLRACAGGYDGDVSQMGQMGEVTFTGSEVGAHSLPLMVGFPMMAPMSNLATGPSTTAPSTDGTTDNLITITYPGHQDSGVLLCDAAGLVARMSIGNQPMVVGLSYFPNSTAPQFLRIPHLPLQTWSSGQVGPFSFFDAYIPVTPDKHATLALVNAQTEILADVALDQLPGCPRLAPTATGYGLILLTVALLAIGSWALGLRPGYQSLASL